MNEENYIEQLDGGRRSPMSIVLIIAGVAAVIAALGAVGYISGTGWFGYRQIMYGSGQLYALNMGDKPLDVSVDGREAVTVPPEDARVLELIGGQSSVVVRDTSGKEIATHSIFSDDSHALLKLTKDGCLAASDIGFVYGRGAQKLEFVEMIEKDQQTYVPGTKSVVWPRESFPAKMARQKGQPLWIELVACTLLEEPKFLRAYLDVRLQERLSKDEKKAR